MDRVRIRASTSSSAADSPPAPKHALLDASLAFRIPAHPFMPPTPGHGVLREGWLLKKRRKKLQGYARRYFVLRPSGHLTYSFAPGSEVRDQIYIPTAAISSTPGRKDIHIDSGTVTFHIKCLTVQDFDEWMSSLRKFTAAGNEVEKTLGRRPSIARALVFAAVVRDTTTTVELLGKTIAELEVALSAADDATLHGDFDKTQNGKGKCKEKESKEGSSLLAKFRKSSPASNSQRTVGANATSICSASSRNRDNASVHLDALREHHRMLTEHLRQLSTFQVHTSRLTTPMPATIGEDIATPIAATPTTAWQLSKVPNNRTSISSAWSNTDGSGSVWYDAVEGDELGAQEFVVPSQDETADDGYETNSPDDITVAHNSLDKDEESEVEANISVDDSVDEVPDRMESVSRRVRLPAKPCGDEGSLFTILKKSVGQDLSNIAFPVTFNEPLTLLQRSAEEFEYCELLDQAATSSDWAERMCYIAAFAVSGYACTKHRSGRKGFTPMLGETYEDIRINFVAEKVVHKPLVIAYHASGRGWELDATSSGKTKFWGKSFEIIPTGAAFLTIGDDRFEWNKPSSFTRNLMMGTKYLEHCGELVVKNHKTGAMCVLDFKETGYWASTPNVVSGTVYSPDGNEAARLEGKWDEQMAQKLDSSHLRILWRANPFPRNATDYYGYSYFAITLNEFTSDIADKLPCTDSRFRSDVRALEEGDIEFAESEKARIEQMQRERRQNGQDPRPRWFKQVDGSDRWVYTGGYWEARKSGWKSTDLTKLW